MSEEISADDGTEDMGQKLSEITKEAARERLQQLIEWGFGQEDPVLIEALPSVGKSYGAVKWASKTGNPVTILTERHDLYDQYEKWATDDFGLVAWQLPVFQTDCPTVQEEVVELNSDLLSIVSEEGDKEIRDRVLQKYRQGISGRELHQKATTYFDKQLPCQHNGSCPYIEALDRDLEEVDVLIGNFRQAFAERYRKGRYIFFDEFPNSSFIQTFSPQVASETVTRYVSREQELPFEHWEDTLGYNSDNEPAVNEWLKNHNRDRDNRPLYRGENSQIDTRGPLLTEIAARFERLDNGWRRADLGEGRIAVRSPNDETLYLLDPPPIDDTEGVIALDGTPCIEKWKLLLGENLRHRSVFTEREKLEYLREVQNLRFIQTEEGTKPYHGGRSVTPDSDVAFIEAVKQRESQNPSLISSKTAIEDYQERGLDQIINQQEHYNNLKGVNKFGSDSLGIVIGCPQPSDDQIELWGALEGRSITRKEDKNGHKTKGTDLDFGEFGNRILRDTRDNEVFQAAMRFGRDEANGATIYIHTAALPAWIESEKAIPSIHAWDRTKGVTKVVEAIKSRDDWQTSEWKTTKLAESIDSLSRRQVLNVLRDVLEEEGYIQSRRGGRGNGYIWSNDCLDDAGEYGIVDW